MSKPVAAISARVVTRRFRIRLGPMEFLLERDERAASYTIPVSPLTDLVKPRRPVVGFSLAGTTAIVLATITAASFGIVGTGAEAGGLHYKVAVPVPAAVERSARRTGAERAGKRSVAPASVAERSPERFDEHGPGSKELVAAEGPGANSVLDDAELVAAGREQAIQAALSTGHLQEWKSDDGIETGFVVVGEAQADDRECRNLSVLTKREAESRVVQMRGCLAPGKSRTWVTLPEGPDQYRSG